MADYIVVYVDVEDVPYNKIEAKIDAIKLRFEKVRENVIYIPIDHENARTYVDVIRLS